MTQYLDQEALCNRPHTDAERSRKCLAFLDEPSLLPVINDIISNITDRTNVDHACSLLMLPGTIIKHKLCPTDASTVGTSDSTQVTNYMAELSTINALKHAPLSVKTPSHDEQSIASDLTSADHSVFLPSPVIKDAINAFKPSPQRYGYQNKQSTSKQHNYRFKRFKGRCLACEQHGHHAKDCWFLKKLERCLEHLSKNKNLPSQLRQNANKSGNYKDYIKRSNIVQSLVANSFIPFDEVDPDVFVNAVMDESVHVPDSDELSVEDN